MYTYAQLPQTQFDPSLSVAQRTQNAAALSQLLASLAASQANVQNTNTTTNAQLLSDRMNAENARYGIDVGADLTRGDQVLRERLGLGDFANQRYLSDNEREVQSSGILANLLVNLRHMQNQAAQSGQAMGLKRDIIDRVLQTKLRGMFMDSVATGMDPAVAAQLSGIGGQGLTPEGMATISAAQQKAKAREAARVMPMQINTLASIAGGANDRLLQTPNEKVLADLASAPNFQEKFLQMATGSPTLPEHFGSNPDDLARLMMVLDEVRTMAGGERGWYQNWGFSGVSNDQIAGVIESLNAMIPYLREKAQQGYSE